MMRVFLISLMLAALVVRPVLANTQWIMIETRLIPQECRHPLLCLSRSRVTLRNIMTISDQASWQLTHTLNSMSALRQIPDSDVKVLATAPDLTQLHELSPAEKPSLLTNHPGVYFDSTRLDEEELTAGFGAHVRDTLSAAGMKFLTMEELDATPGRPTLSVRFSERAESGGCVIPFAVSMSISEETVMVRHPDLKVTGSSWSGTQKENLANFNYTPFVALKELTQKLADNYMVANGEK